MMKEGSNTNSNILDGSVDANNEQETWSLIAATFDLGEDSEKKKVIVLIEEIIQYEHYRLFYKKIEKCRNILFQ